VLGQKGKELAERDGGQGGVISMDAAGPAQGIAWQAEHAARNGSPLTGRILRACLPLLSGGTGVGRLMAGWTGNVLEDAMPLRLAGGLHWLHLAGIEPRLAPIYTGALTDEAAIATIIAEVVHDHAAALLPWFDGPPQTNEAGRSGALMGGLLWLSQRLGARFELLEIGSSAGANTMVERYAYDLGGTKVGPVGSPVLIRPEWRGPPPPAAPVEVVSIQGCDRAPIDLADHAEALRLKSYIWPDMTERLHRLDAVEQLAHARPPRIARADAADWVEARLAEAQVAGVTRVLYHSIVWQYLPPEGRGRIEAAMAAAGARATPERPLAWLALETNRQTFRHELTARSWPGGETPVLLGEAHAHGAWVEWRGVP